jgi:hypothetical protein
MDEERSAVEDWDSGRPFPALSLNRFSFLR